MKLARRKMLVDKNENIITPKWLIELFDNYDRQSLNYKGTVEKHRVSLLEDAESLSLALQDKYLSKIKDRYR